MSPPAMDKREDLSPPFICNVTSMYSLLVTELEKMAGQLYGRTRGDFLGIGYIVMTAGAKKDQLQLTVPIFESFF